MGMSKAMEVYIRIVDMSQTANDMMRDGICLNPVILRSDHLDSLCLAPTTLIVCVFHVQHPLSLPLPGALACEDLRNNVTLTIMIITMVKLLS